MLKGGAGVAVPWTLGLQPSWSGVWLNDDAAHPARTGRWADADHLIGALSRHRLDRRLRRGESGAARFANLALGAALPGDALPVRGLGRPACGRMDPGSGADRPQPVQVDGSPAATAAGSASSSEAAAGRGRQDRTAVRIRAGMSNRTPPSRSTNAPGSPPPRAAGPRTARRPGCRRGSRHRPARSTPAPRSTQASPPRSGARPPLRRKPASSAIRRRCSGSPAEKGLRKGIPDRSPEQPVEKVRQRGISPRTARPRRRPPTARRPPGRRTRRIVRETRRRSSKNMSANWLTAASTLRSGSGRRSADPSTQVIGPVFAPGHVQHVGRGIDPGNRAGRTGTGGGPRASGPRSRIRHRRRGRPARSGPCRRRPAPSGRTGPARSGCRRRRPGSASTLRGSWYDPPLVGSSADPPCRRCAASVGARPSVRR